MPNRQNVTGEIAPGTKLRHRPELTRSPDNMDPQPPPPTKEELAAEAKRKEAVDQAAADRKAAEKPANKGEQADKAE